MSENWTFVSNVRCEIATIACVDVSFVSKTLQSPFPSHAYRLRARSNPWMGSASGLLGVLVPRILIQWQDVGSRGKHWFSRAKTEAGRFIGRADRLNWSQSNHPGTHPHAVCCAGLLILLAVKIGKLLYQMFLVVGVFVTVSYVLKFVLNINRGVKFTQKDTNLTRD